jgi:predicted dehydrogenase
MDHLISDVPGVCLAAVCRKRTEEPQVGGLSDLPVYGDYRLLIADPLVQAVIVVTPPSLCHDICLAAVQAGKPMLIEKPLATTSKEARAMVAAADKAGVLLMTAQTMRFDPTILSVKQHLATLGRLQRATLVSHIDSAASLVSRSSTTSPPGALLEIGVHLLDLTRFLTGEEVAEVACVLKRSIGLPEAAAQASLRTRSGVECFLDIARVDSGRVGTMEWVGTQGTMRADWTRRTVSCRIGGGASTEWTVEQYPTIVTALLAFIHAIKTRTPPPVTGVDGCRAVELVDACYRSADLGGIPVRPV